jgi:hypothetical protein
MNVQYGVGTAPPVPASQITASGNWAKVTSVRVTLQVVGGDATTSASTAGANSTADRNLLVTLVPATPSSAAISYTENDTRLRQVFTGTAALRNRNL